jgi:hypothetical protein
MRLHSSREAAEIKEASGFSRMSVTNDGVIYMLKNWKENWQLKVIALLLALALWFYVYKK